MYSLCFENELEFKRNERCLKRIDMFSFKKLMFEIYPNLKEGKFESAKPVAEYYEMPIPSSNPLFEKVHGQIKLIFKIENKTVILVKILPEEIMKERVEELTTYKGVVISKNHPDKDIFKINLLTMLNKK